MVQQGLLAKPSSLPIGLCVRCSTDEPPTPQATWGGASAPLSVDKGDAVGRPREWRQRSRVYSLMLFGPRCYSLVPPPTNARPSPLLFYCGTVANVY